MKKVKISLRELKEIANDSQFAIKLKIQDDGKKVALPDTSGVGWEIANLVLEKGKSGYLIKEGESIIYHVVYHMKDNELDKEIECTII